MSKLKAENMELIREAGHRRDMGARVYWQDTCYLYDATGTVITLDNYYLFLQQPERKIPTRWLTRIEFLGG